MATKLIILDSLEAVQCSSNVSMAPGDLVSLVLDQGVDPELPETIQGIVQPPVERVKMLDTSGCVALGFRYVVSYESDDLNGAVLELSPGLVMNFGCVTCCEALDAKIQVVFAVITPLELTGPPVSGTTAGKKGQKAYVRTTQGGIPYVDIWECTRETPSQWQPPSGFVSDLGNAGMLMRPYVDVDNTWTWKPAYP